MLLMPYSDTNMTKAVMKPSPSLIYNNLCSAGNTLVYAHTRQACTLQPSAVVAGTPAAVRRVESPHTDVVHSVRAVTHGDVTYVVLATEAGLQVWDQALAKLVHVWVLPDPGAQANKPQSSFARGVASTLAADKKAHLCFGSSLGNLHVLEFAADGKFQPAPSTFPHHKAPITAIGSAHQTRRGKSHADVTAKLVTADESGAVAVWDATSSTSYKVSQSITLSSEPVTSLAVRGDAIIAARLGGSVQILGLADGALRSEFVAHSRWLTAMEVHPTKDVVATVSEDATINVWTLPSETSKVTNLLSACWLNGLLTGVAFCGTGGEDVAVVAYDTDEIRIFKS